MVKVFVDIIELRLNLHLLLRKVRFVLLRFLQQVLTDFELLDLFPLASCSLIYHVVDILNSQGAIIHFLKELFKFVLSIARLFEHLIQVCVRIGQFSLHFFDNIMKGFLSRGDGVSRLI